MKNLLYLLAAALLIASCKKDPVTYDLSLSKTTIAMHYDEADTLKLVHMVENTKPLEFTFTSSDTNTVKVDNNGVVKGVSVGEATIMVSATNGAASAKCNVTIVPYSNMFVEPPFKWNLTYDEAKALIAPGDLLKDMGKGRDLYAKWIAPVDSIRYNFFDTFSGTSLYIDLSTDTLFKEALLFTRERCGNNYEIQHHGVDEYCFTHRHKERCVMAIDQGSAGRIHIVYRVSPN